METNNGGSVQMQTCDLSECLAVRQCQIPVNCKKKEEKENSQGSDSHQSIQLRKQLGTFS